MNKNIRRSFFAASVREDVTSAGADTATVTHIRTRAAVRARNGAALVIEGARAARAEQALRAARAAEAQAPALPVADGFVGAVERCAHGLTEQATGPAYRIEDEAAPFAAGVGPAVDPYGR
ncbi:hypothetical protein ABZ464_32180 [Streptomyces sp. NPDC005820]|uniref:hypothetical protein n=1 Tax=Streptomyces sp. NPDC005820 TaxID=3157069 RepID=UPI0033DB36B4